jgi:methionyl aminopeptidase
MDRQTITQPRQLRSAREIGLMRRAGLVVWEAHQAAARLVRPGVTTQELDDAIAEVFRQHRAIPLFLGYPGKTPFPAATCISINEQVVHGIPGPRTLVAGDIVSVDTGCSLAGWCGDAAVTHSVGEVSPTAKRLLQVTLSALNLAIEQMMAQSRWSQIARQMQRFVEAQGFSVIETLVGHGIGRKMHEAPQVPNYFDPKLARDDFDVRPGVVLAIEPMINVGSKQVRTLADHWTIVTADGSLSAHFEHTVARTDSGVRRLTSAPEECELELVGEAFRDASRWMIW